MSVVIERLRIGRGLAWGELVTVFDHAIALAKEAEYDANRAMNIAMTGVDVAYPPIVLMLAESVPAPERTNPRAVASK